MHQKNMRRVLSDRLRLQIAVDERHSELTCQKGSHAARRGATMRSSPPHPAQVTAAGAASGKYSLQPRDQELVFMGERCRDEQTLRDYGVCEPWIVQVRRVFSMARQHHTVKVGLPWPHLQQSTSKHCAQCRMTQQSSSFLQVAGFTVNPEQPGKRLANGVLVPCEG